MSAENKILEEKTAEKPRRLSYGEQYAQALREESADFVVEYRIRKNLKEGSKSYGQQHAENLHREGKISAAQYRRYVGHKNTKES